MRFVLALLFTSAVIKSNCQQLVLPGANPDPSVTKIGNAYWGSATSSNWFPAFPLFYSKDLITWEQKGYIFYKMPAWADYYFGRRKFPTTVAESTFITQHIKKTATCV